MFGSDPVPDIQSPPAPRKRLFETGQMKLLVLHFIAQAPRFIYDIIKDVAALVGGDYKPSTGTICPTVNYLEEQQYTQVVMSTDERKQYHITDKGRAHLKDNHEALQKVLKRFDTRRQIQDNERYAEIRHAMESLKEALKHKIQHTKLSADQVQEIAEKIDRAAIEIVRM